MAILRQSVFRKFDGKIFKGVEKFTNKETAVKRGKALRKTGYRVRVIESVILGINIYIIFVR